MCPPCAGRAHSPPAFRLHSTSSSTMARSSELTSRSLTSDAASSCDRTFSDSRPNGKSSRPDGMTNAIKRGSEGDVGRVVHEQGTFSSSLLYVSNAVHIPAALLARARTDVCDTRVVVEGGARARRQSVRCAEQCTHELMRISTMYDMSKRRFHRPTSLLNLLIEFPPTAYRLFAPAAAPLAMAEDCPALREGSDDGTSSMAMCFSAARSAFTTFCAPDLSPCFDCCLT